MTDLRPWLHQNGYVDDPVPDAVVLHKEAPGGPRITVRRDAGFWSIASYVNRANGTVLSFVTSGIPDPELGKTLPGCEAEFAWLFQTFHGK